MSDEYWGFEERLKAEKLATARFDTLIKKCINTQINPATAAQDLQGIDRWYDMHGTKELVSVQYKVDFKAATWDRAFCELVHVGPSYLKHGWMYKCIADWLVIYVPDNHICYWLKPAHLRNLRDGWVRKYELKKSPNKGYWSIGVVVPLSIIKKVALQVFELPRG